jgi:type IV secretory pathway VirB10-like protein
MLSNRAAFALLAVACITAAGGGAYFATRQGMPSAVPVDASAPSATPAIVNDTPKPVQETEAVVGDAPRTQPVAAAQPAPTPASRRREEIRPGSPRPTPRAAQAPQSTNARNEQLPTLDRSWPSSASSPAQQTAPAPEPPAPVAPVEERAVIEPSRTPEPPAPTFEEVVVSADSVLGVQLETSLSSETARVEDKVESHVVRDVRAGGVVAIPAGARALGSVTLVERGGKFKETARIGIRFHTLVLADGTRLPITTDTIYREGDAPGQASAAKIGGGAVIGAILGGIAGGAKGAAIGAATGGGAGTTAVALGDRKPATFLEGAEVTARILSPVTVTIEK